MNRVDMVFIPDDMMYGSDLFYENNTKLAGLAQHQGSSPRDMLLPAEIVPINLRLQFAKLDAWKHEPKCSLKIKEEATKMR